MGYMRQEGANGRSSSLRWFSQVRGSPLWGHISHHPTFIDDESLVCAGPNEELGTIRVTMSLTCSAGKPRSRVPYPGLGRAVPEIGAMHEKSKKVGVHAVS